MKALGILNTGRQIMKFMALCLGILLIAGCKPSDSTSEEKSESGVVDTMLQRDTMEAGRRAADQLREIDDMRQEEMESVMGEW